MPLVTEDQVRTLLRENVTDMANSEVTPHITTADLIITEDFASSGLTTARLTQIELYLAAHFAVLAWERGGLRRVDIGTSQEEYKGISFREMGFSSTRFGQQALALDPTGTLQIIEDRVSHQVKEALFRVL